MQQEDLQIRLKETAMNVGRQVNRKTLCRRHRELWYCYYLDRLITGQAKPADVTLRYRKLKEVRK